MVHMIAYDIMYTCSAFDNADRMAITHFSFEAHTHIPTQLNSVKKGKN